MTGADVRAFLLAAAGLGIAALLPLWDQGYFLSMGLTVAMFTVLATSWALFSGPTHLISLATAAFFGVGSFVTGLGLDRNFMGALGMAPLPYWVLPPLAAILGAGLAALVGAVTLRLSGVYFVIFTLGLAELVRQIVIWAQTRSGQRGLYVFTSFGEREIYWQLLGMAALVWLAGWAIGRSRLGFALRIIGNDETVAKHSGINTALAKILLFMVSGAVAATVGAMLAPRFIYIEPATAFAPLLSFQVVIMALLGGTGRLWGPLAGVIPFTLLYEWVTRTAPTQTMLLLGLTFLLIVYLLPGGFVGLIQRLRRRWHAGEGG
jgi:branched-chain amino acid transport system permease protein